MSFAQSDVLFPFDNSYAQQLEGFYAPWEGDKAPHPKLVLFNDALARAFGFDEDGFDGDLAAYLSGGVIPHGSKPLAQAYAGHQFGGFSPQLGDGRALLLGEVLDKAQNRFDVHLKGSGPTPFSRGGDGKAVLGPVLREYIMGEAMHALGIPTTRGLSVVTTGEQILRQGYKPGAVLARIASSHLRVGTFQFFAARQDWEKVRQLADYAIARHDPELIDRDDRYLAFLGAVGQRQATLITRWMEIGFIHGVMNTDNMTISGETIDYGPCAFMDVYDPDTVFSSIDKQGRYAYGNQPVMARWNLTRLAETLVPLIDPSDQDRAINLATDVIAEFMPHYRRAWVGGMTQKIGLASVEEGDEQFLRDLFNELKGNNVDYTSFFRRLADTVHGEDTALLEQFEDPTRMADWLGRWRLRLQSQQRSLEKSALSMNQRNPLYIPRNHLVEEALQQAEDEGSFDLTHALMKVLETPFTYQQDRERFQEPAPNGSGQYQTFCGT